MRPTERPPQNRCEHINHRPARVEDLLADPARSEGLAAMQIELQRSLEEAAARQSPTPSPSAHCRSSTSRGYSPSTQVSRTSVANVSLYRRLRCRGRRWRDRRRAPRARADGTTPFPVSAEPGPERSRSGHPSRYHRRTSQTRTRSAGHPSRDGQSDPALRGRVPRDALEERTTGRVGEKALRAGHLETGNVLREQVVELWYNVVALAELPQHEPTVVSEEALSPPAPGRPPDPLWIARQVDDRCRHRAFS